ncbi:MAG: toxin [Pseudanabaena frigida]|uniref:Toxin n=1 Tax=Pseudanabaena frigida TaxID=945775 RepID=A0A2W4WLT6_9CYAN|nr:MAG: toxin [Pseudanabaena frigida]
MESRKNDLLKVERGISFEEVVAAIESENFLDILAHPNQKQYPNQYLFVIRIKGYVWLVPFVREGNQCFLKTAFPSRKANKNYAGDSND